MLVPENWKPSPRPRDDMFNFLEQELFDLSVLEGEYERRAKPLPIEMKCRRYCLEKFTELCTTLENREMVAAKARR